MELIAVEGLPLIEGETDIGSWIVSAVRGASLELEAGDVLVIAHKIVSKAEGAVVDLAEVQPSTRAKGLAVRCGKDPRLVEVILGESVEIVRQRGGHLISEHRLGHVCANAAVDQSNAGGAWQAVMLPRDPDRSAEHVREAVRSALGVEVAVVISDTHGRAFRNGAVGVAVGICGLDPLLSWRGRTDLDGREMLTSEEAVGDELAAAASLLMGQGSEGRPLVVVRGFPHEPGRGSARDLLRPKERDLFR